MYIKIYRLLATLFFALLIGISVFVTLGVGGSAIIGATVAYAAPSDIVPYPPTVTVVASTVMTTGSLPTQPISITVEPNCGDPETGCLPPNGSLQVSIVSVFSKNLTTVSDVDVLTTYVQTPFSMPRTFNYNWILPNLDNQQVVISAMATNTQPAVGSSTPFTITLDTVSPIAHMPQPAQTPWITASSVIYSWTPASDGAGIAFYRLNITNTASYSAMFTTTQTAFTFTQFAADGVDYFARLQAVDSFGNVGEWSDLSAPVALDTSAPTVVITAPVTHIGLSPFSVQWQATDSDSPISRVILTYAGPGTITGTKTYTGFTSAGSQSDLFTLPQDDMAYGTYTFTVSAENNANLKTTRFKNTEVTTMMVFLPLVLKNYPPSWTRAGGTAGIGFHSASFCGNGSNQVWYAGTTQNGVWKSTDNGLSWTQLVDVSPYPYPVIANPNATGCNEAFVAIWGAGVNKIAGTTVTPVNTNLTDLYLYGLAITGTTFYAGTNSGGVFKTDINAINWQPINTGITDRRIRSLSVSGNNVYAGARNCKLYVSSNNGSSWAEKTVLTSGCNDAQVWSVTQVGATLFAGLGGAHGLYISHNNGDSWSKVSSVPENTIYGIAYDDVNGKLYVSALGSGIYRCDVAGSVTCNAYNNGLGTSNTRELAIANGKVVVSTDDGLWYLQTFK